MVRFDIPGAPMRVLRALVPALALASAWPAVAAVHPDKYNVVASLAASEGSGFTVPLTQGADGLMYGVSTVAGTLFRVEADGRLTVLQMFTGPNGLAPNGLTLGTDGWLYGTTFDGGANNLGEIFKVSTAGDFVVTYSFSSTTNGGLVTPLTALVPDGQGGFYAGAGYYRQSIGALFHYVPATGAVDVVDQFKGPKLGRRPVALVMSPSGTLYGLTERTQSDPSAATAFSYTPGGSLKTLHTFDACTDGRNPAPRIVYGPDKAIYGVMRTLGGGVVGAGAGDCTGSGSGTVFRVSNKGVFSVVYVFGRASGSPDPGDSPWGGLTIDTSGTLYGTTSDGGARAGGTLFSMTLAGQPGVLISLGKGLAVNGYGSLAAPTWVDGKLWGLNALGGGEGNGVVFREDLAP